MGLFSSIMAKIFHPSQAAEPTAGPSTSAAAAPSAPAGPSTSAAPAAPAATTAAPAAAPAQPVEAVLVAMASHKAGGGGNWRTSIVDLLKLLDLESSLDARKSLANELGVHAGADGSAEQNIALHKAVMRKLAENGGKVPDSLKD